MNHIIFHSAWTITYIFLKRIIFKRTKSVITQKTFPHFLKGKNSGSIKFLKHFSYKNDMFDRFVDASKNKTLSVRNLHCVVNGSSCKIFLINLFEIMKII